MDISLPLSKYTLGMLPPEQLPELACTMMANGFDSESLRRLAGAGADPIENRRLFVAGLGESKIALPTPADAALTLARGIARDIVSERVSPYEGARAIWGIWNASGQPLALASFVGLASEYEDCPNHRAAYASDILAACEALLPKTDERG